MKQHASPVRKNLFAATCLLGLGLFLASCSSQSKQTCDCYTTDTTHTDCTNAFLKGKVKTINVAFYEATGGDFFGPKFKKGGKHELAFFGIHRFLITFNEDGSYKQELLFDKNDDLLDKTDYVYTDTGHVKTQYSTNWGGQTKIFTYNKDNKLLEKAVIDNQGDTIDGEINRYDARGNHIENIRRNWENFVQARTEYDYNDKNQLVEERSYYEKRELSVKILYTYNQQGLLADKKEYQYVGKARYLTEHNTYAYTPQGDLYEEYELDDDTRELVLCERYQNDRVTYITSQQNDSWPGMEKVYFTDSVKYNYDYCNNWVSKKEFEGYMPTKISGLVMVTGYITEREFTYY